MASHWFGASQWQLPNEVDYRKLQELFTRIAIDKHIQQKLEHPHHQLVATYQSLNRKYSELLEEYKILSALLLFPLLFHIPMYGRISLFSFIRANIHAKNLPTC